LEKKKSICKRKKVFGKEKKRKENNSISQSIASAIPPTYVNNTYSPRKEKEKRKKQNCDTSAKSNPTIKPNHQTQPPNPS
jgi:hypothetical protein